MSPSDAIHRLDETVKLLAIERERNGRLSGALRFAEEYIPAEQLDEFRRLAARRYGA